MKITLKLSGGPYDGLTFPSEESCDCEGEHELGVGGSRYVFDPNDPPRKGKTEARFVEELLCDGCGGSVDQLPDGIRLPGWDPEEGLCPTCLIKDCVKDLGDDREKRLELLADVERVFEARGLSPEDRRTLRALLEAAADD